MTFKRVFGWACLLIATVCVTESQAQQPPDIGRWTGQTAQTQAQGFSQGDPLRLTWGFVNDGLNIPSFNAGAAADSDIQAWLATTYGSFANGQAEFGSTFDRWSELAGLEYSFEANDDGAAFATTSGVLGTRADVRIGGRRIDGNGGTLAFNFFPNFADMVIDTDDSFYGNNNDVNTNFRGTRNVVAHEHGHGLGMPHVEPVNQSFLMEPFISFAFDGPQHHDILMAHRGYGDVNEKSNNFNGNDTAALATGLGTVADGATVSVGDSARTFAVAATETDFVSIDDQTDADFFSFDITAPSEVDINLEALGFQYQAGPQFGTPVAFNTEDRSDLSLELFDQDGSTLIASADATGFGQDELLSSVLLSASGTYFLRVSGADNTGNGSDVDTQFYSLQISAVNAIPEPGSLAILSLISLGFLGTRRRR